MTIEELIGSDDDSGALLRNICLALADQKLKRQRDGRLYGGRPRYSLSDDDWTVVDDTSLSCREAGRRLGVACDSVARWRKERGVKHVPKKRVTRGQMSETRRTGVRRGLRGPDSWIPARWVSPSGERFVVYRPRA